MRWTLDHLARFEETGPDLLRLSGLSACRDRGHQAVSAHVTSKRRFALDLSPLRLRDFRLVYTAAGVSSFGSMITYVTIPFQLKQMTGDPLMVGLLGVVELVPLLFMAFVGGALADYLDRRKLVFWAEAALAALTGLLLLNALVGSPQVWVLFVIAGLAAAVDGVHRPAMDAMMPRLAPAEQMAAVGALNSLRWQVAQIAGPTLAGLMIANLDVAWVFGFDLATFVVSLICFGDGARGRPAGGGRAAVAALGGRGHPVRPQPPRADRHLPGRHQRDVLRLPGRPLPVGGRQVRRRVGARPLLRRAGHRLPAGHGHLGLDGPGAPARPGGAAGRGRLGPGHRAVRPGRLALAGAARPGRRAAPRT